MEYILAMWSSNPFLTVDCSLASISNRIVDSQLNGFLIWCSIWLMVWLTWCEMWCTKDEMWCTKDIKSYMVLLAEKNLHETISVSVWNYKCTKL